MQENKWNYIISSYSLNPRDVITTPLGNRKGRWFHASVEDGKLFISKAKEHTISSRLKFRRMLNPNELKEVFDLYLKRKQGTPVSQDVLKATINGSYWFGIFNDLDLR